MEEPNILFLIIDIIMNTDNIIIVMATILNTIIIIATIAIIMIDNIIITKMSTAINITDYHVIIMINIITNIINVLLNMINIIQVVTTRGAFRAPELKNVGLIVIDEEQEASFRQDSPAPRYHARDVALIRAKYEKAVAILSSATPSLESYHNYLTRKINYLGLRKFNYLYLKLWVNEIFSYFN